MGDEIRQSLTNLEPEQRYAVRVRSVDSLGNKSEWSEALEFQATDTEGSVPNVPANIKFDWTGNDAIVTWDPVTRNLNNTIATIVSYEFCLLDPELSTQLAPVVKKIYSTPSTTFTYTRDMILADWGEEFDGDIAVVVRAVSSSGLRSALGVQAFKLLSHQTPPKPPKPQLTNLGDRILVSMASNLDNYDTGTLQISADGGDTWSTAVANTTSHTYLHIPPDDGVRYYRYKYKDLWGSESVYSDESYASATGESGGTDYGTWHGPAYDVDYSGVVTITSSADSFVISDIITLPDAPDGVEAMVTLEMMFFPTFGTPGVAPSPEGWVFYRHSGPLAAFTHQVPVHGGLGSSTLTIPRSIMDSLQILTDDYTSSYDINILAQQWTPGYFS